MYFISHKLNREAERRGFAYFAEEERKRSEISSIRYFVLMHNLNDEIKLNGWFQV